MNITLLFGWPYPTWRQVADWAGFEVSLADFYNESEWPRLLSLRQKWLLAGGPSTGPSGKLVLA